MEPLLNRYGRAQLSRDILGLVLVSSSANGLEQKIILDLVHTQIDKEKDMFAMYKEMKREDFLKMRMNGLGIFLQENKILSEDKIVWMVRSELRGFVASLFSSDILNHYYNVLKTYIMYERGIDFRIGNTLFR